MTSLQTMHIAVQALLRHKLRSFLTALGIVIGVAAVIAMVSIGDGARTMLQSSFEGMGSNLLIIMPGTTTAGGVRGGYGSRPTLSWEDMAAIQREVPSVKLAAPQLRSNVHVLSEERNWTTTATGTTPAYFRIRNWTASSGALLSMEDDDLATKVVVLGQTVVDKLFGPDVDPVGKSVRIRNTPFQIVGVLSRKGQTAWGQDFDDGIFIPSSTFRARLQGGLTQLLSGVILVATAGPEVLARAQRQITSLLRERHHLPEDSSNDFSIRNLNELADAQQEGMRTVTTLLASIAAVSLLIGGVGIMNIMLVSVTERTREIGLRLAVGARPSDIMCQFLGEALTLSIAGGVIGVVTGVVTAEELSASLAWPLLIRPQVILTAMAFSGLVGVGFGLYPARKASLLDPIEALRFE